jgi:16S rRNA (guanine966-N2)-methyltransferase
MRGRLVAYNGDPATRPMKQRTREAVFSLLGGKFDGHWCLDLFGGTGILGMEAVSRGATSATILELSRPAVGTMLANLSELGLEDRVRVLHVDTLRWLKHVEASIQIQAPPSPWIIFACPPYRMWLAEREKLIPGLDELFRLAPADSALVCETDRTFDLPSAMEHLEWDTRNYEPAFVSIARK